MKTVTSLVASFTLLSLEVQYASADTMLSNLQQPNSASFSAGSGSGSGEVAIQFLTGSSASVWNLDSVTLSFGGPIQWGTRDNGPILYSASIYNDASDTPTSQLAFLGSFNFTDQTTSVLQVTFDPSTTVSLDSNSEYWIMVGAVTTCPNGILEGTAGHKSDVSGTGWQFGETGFYFNGGTFLGGSSSTTPFLQIQATAQAVPEPFTFTLIGLAATIVFFRRRSS